MKARGEVGCGVSTFTFVQPLSLEGRGRPGWVSGPAREVQWASSVLARKNKGRHYAFTHVHTSRAHTSIHTHSVKLLRLKPGSGGDRGGTERESPVQNSFWGSPEPRSLSSKYKVMYVFECLTCMRTCKHRNVSRDECERIGFILLGCRSKCVVVLGCVQVSMRFFFSFFF